MAKKDPATDLESICVDALARQPDGRFTVPKEGLATIKAALLALKGQPEIIEALEKVASFALFLESQKNSPAACAGILAVVNEVAKARGASVKAARKAQGRFQDFIDVPTDPSAPRFDAKAPEGTIKAGMIGNKFRR